MKPNRLIQYTLILSISACTVLKSTSEKTVYGGSFEKYSSTNNDSVLLQSGNHVFTNTASELIPQTIHNTKQFEVVNHSLNGQLDPHPPKKPDFEKPFINYIDSPEVTPKIAPVEPLAKIGFWLSLGGFLGLFIPFVNYLAGFSLIGGFVLGIIGLVNINKSNGKYRGRGKAYFAIFIPVILLVLLAALVFLLLSYW